MKHAIYSWKCLCSNPEPFSLTSHNCPHLVEFLILTLSYKNSNFKWTLIIIIMVALEQRKTYLFLTFCFGMFIVCLKSHCRSWWPNLQSHINRQISYQVFKYGYGSYMFKFHITWNNCHALWLVLAYGS